MHSYHIFIIVAEIPSRHPAWEAARQPGRRGVQHPEAAGGPHQWKVRLRDRRAGGHGRHAPDVHPGN